MQEGLICPRCRETQKSLNSLVRHALSCTLNEQQQQQQLQQLQQQQLGQNSYHHQQKIDLTPRKPKPKAAHDSYDRALHARVEFLENLKFFGAKRNAGKGHRQVLGSSGSSGSSSVIINVHQQTKKADTAMATSFVKGKFVHNYDLQTFLANQVCVSWVCGEFLF